ncbi:MAG: PilZ domain-containing protein [Planctomycetes bacterium]|nr:PilZ domain-containing protein [Planctomycetota bacterium]
MKIQYHTIGNRKIALTAATGDLTGRGALSFQEFLEASLDKDSAYLLINMKKASKVDGLGLRMFDKWFSRGRQTRLFNVQHDVCSFISLAGKGHFLSNVYHETDNENALALFAKELLQNAKEDSGNKRLHPRVATRIPATFKHHPCHNGVIVGRANIINLSEGGVLAGDVVAVNTTNGKEVKRLALVGQELYDLEFPLSDDLHTIRARGECVREIGGGDQLRLGVRFTGIDKDDQEKIHDYAVHAPLEAGKGDINEI